MTSSRVKTDVDAACWESREREILIELKHGERRNLSWLMDHYGEALMRYLVATTGSREMAEDVFQDTWVRTMTGIHRFDLSRPFSAWLYRIARNRAYDCLRRRKRRKWLSLGPGDAEELIPEIRAPGDFRNDLIAADMLATLLAGLDPVLRELIWLRFYQEMSYEELADHCEVPLGTIKSRLARALDQLATRYEKMEGNAHA